MHFLETVTYLVATVCLLGMWVIPVGRSLAWGVASTLLGICLLVLDGPSWPILYIFIAAALAFTFSRREKRPPTLSELNAVDSVRGTEQ